MSKENDDNLCRITPSHEDYRRLIERYAASSVDKRVSNGLSAHAAILIETMFKTASSEMRIFSRDLNEEVFCSNEMIQAIVTFVAKPYSTLKILLEKKPDDGWSNSHSLLQSLRKLDVHGTVEVMPAVGNYAAGKAEHFAVMDDDGYRFEFDHDNCQAVANFNESMVAKKLISAFDQAFELSKEEGETSSFSFFSKPSSLST